MESESKVISKAKQIYWGLWPEIKEWQRSLAFALPGATGEFFRRRYAAKYLKSCGNNLKMYPHGRIYNPGKLTIGGNVVISDYVQISAGGGVVIGDRVILGPSVRIWSINHNYENIDIPIYEQGWTTEPVVIEDDVWIGMETIILAGTVIGKGSIIAAGSLLRKVTIEPYSIVAGNPGQIVKKRISQKI